MRIAGIVLSAAGALVLFIVGVASVKWYAWDIAIEQAGEPDRSMLFWGLPILFLGIVVIAVAGALVVVVVRLAHHKA